MTTSDPSAHELIAIQSFDEVRALLGPLDSNTRLIRELHGVNVLVRDGSLRLMGKPADVQRVHAVLTESLQRLREGKALKAHDVSDRLRERSPVPVPANAASSAVRSLPGRTAGPLNPKTPGQRQYWEAMQQSDVVLCVGPAGTGKTYMAVAAAIAAVRSGEARRIVLVRPAVEAGEKLGFLPGDLQQKVDPYLRPLYDALHDLLDPAARQRYFDSEVLEVCPLAYMRGRTLNDAFVILDEAQNCTIPQMLMFLTRMGQGSQVVVTGDPSQVDLPTETRSGLADAVVRLEGIQGVGVVRLTPLDVVRHAVVQRILDAYTDK